MGCVISSLHSGSALYNRSSKWFYWDFFVTGTRAQMVIGKNVKIDKPNKKKNFNP